MEIARIEKLRIEKLKCHLKLLLTENIGLST